MRVKLLFVLVLLSLVSISGQTVASKADRQIPGAPDESAIVILQPDLSDIESAAKQGLHVFKLLPRGMYDYENNPYGLRGGGAYYSFVKRSHSYNMTPQIQLGKSGDLSTGFSGADYGFIYDLGNVELSTVDTKLPEVKFLDEYRPPLYEPQIRKEQRKAIDGTEGYQSRLSPSAGHTYILRNISFRDADSLVALRVERINEDGSAIIFWKSIKNFEVPKFLYVPDAEIKAKVDEVLKDPKFKDVEASVVDNKITLRGEVAEAEYANLISRVLEIEPLGLTNQVMKKRD
jgi:hypothetical protein